MKNIILLLLFFYFSINSNAQNLSQLLAKSKDGYKISGEIKNIQDTTVILAYYFGGKQYASDTTDIVNGKLVFSGKKVLLVSQFYRVDQANNYKLSKAFIWPIRFEKTCKKT